jgi:hypothetical protein
MRFTTAIENILDLFYDGTTDPESEYDELCDVLESKTGHEILDTVYREPMNRASFLHFAVKTCSIDTKTASDIFSCATDCFGAENATRSTPLPDCDMTSAQFTHGSIMLANLFSLMNSDNKKGASKLAMQMVSFLDEVRETYSATNRK